MLQQQKPLPGSTRQRLIDVAEALFYRKGIRAVGVDEIIAEAQVAKATLYRHFAGKEQLIAAYLNQRSSFSRSKLTESAARSVDPQEQILDAFRALENNLENPSFRGCAFLLAVSEHGELETVRAIGQEHKLFVRDHFATLAVQASISAPLIAEQLALIYEGALATIVVRPDASPGHTAIKLVEGLLDFSANREVSK
jgi:AcrR family transcriptional regulator